MQYFKFGRAGVAAKVEENTTYRSDRVSKEVHTVNETEGDTEDKRERDTATHRR